MSFDETEWWGDCTKSFHEEQKQLVYASRMGLRPNWSGAHPPTFDLMGRSIIDIGGGPVSLLLKCVNFSRATVIDPGAWPGWVLGRYAAAGIGYRRQRGEDFSVLSADEVWIYNTLQHVDDPEKVISKARECARTIRLFEWIGIPAYEGHPQELQREPLEEWLGAPGFVTEVNQDGAVGTAFYGVFATGSDAA